VILPQNVTTASWRSPAGFSMPQTHRGRPQALWVFDPDEFVSDEEPITNEGVLCLHTFILAHGHVEKTRPYLCVRACVCYNTCMATRQELHKFLQKYFQSSKTLNFHICCVNTTQMCAKEWRINVLTPLLYALQEAGGILREVHMHAPTCPANDSLRSCTLPRAIPYASMRSTWNVSRRGGTGTIPAWATTCEASGITSCPLGSGVSQTFD
jgi:hypothetical protein